MQVWGGFDVLDALMSQLGTGRRIQLADSPWLLSGKMRDTAELRKKLASSGIE